MILEEDAVLRTRITGALAPEGVNVLSFGRLAPAKEAARRANVDILVLGEAIEGRLASDVALLAEWRNPRLGSILLSDRDAEATEELFDLIPSLQAVLARGTGARTLARVAIATARSQEGIVLLQEDDWTVGASSEEESAAPLAASPAQAAPEPAFVPAHEAPAPARAMAGEAGVAIEDASAPVQAIEKAPASLAVQPAPEALGPFRDRLIQAQQRLLALESSAPEQELPAHRADEASPGLLYALPSFLRDTEDLSDAQDDLGAPHPAMLPVQAAAPRRRLHLA